MEDDCILLVDDDKETLAYLQQLFRLEGVKVDCAATGEEALRKVEEKTFVLLVTDLNMPGLNGIALAEKVRRIAPGIPLIITTGELSPEVVHEASMAGVRQVMAKPVDPEEMLAVVKGIVRTT